MVLQNQQCQLLYTAHAALHYMTQPHVSSITSLQSTIWTLSWRKTKCTVLLQTHHDFTLAVSWAKNTLSYLLPL